MPADRRLALPPTVKERYDLFERHLRQTKATEDEIRKARLVWWAGAAVMFELLTNEVSELTEVDGCTVLSRTRDELADFTTGELLAASQQRKAAES